MISVIIPARNEVYLNKTIENLYKNARGEIEVIVVLEGESAKVDSRARVIPHMNPLGRRVGMNEAAGIAKGEYLFHIDAHCSMSQRWDIKLRESCQDNTLVVSVISAMDENTWENRPGHDYTFVRFNKNLEEKWWGQHKRLEDCEIVEETMALTGCGWLIRKDYYWALGGCDESLGELCHLGVEWALKVWCHHKYPGRLLLRTDVFCGHVFSTSSKNVHRFDPQRLGVEDFRDRMYEKYGDKIEQLRNKFNPPDWKVSEVKEVVTKTEQTICIKKDDGSEDIIDMTKVYFPTERPKDSMITYTDWRLLWQSICDHSVKSMVEFGPGLSTEILDRLGIKLTSYETKESLLAKYKEQMPNVDFVLWDGKHTIDINGQYDMAFIDGPFGGENREFSYKSVAESGVKIVACHDSNRKADKVWIDKYFADWKKGGENPLKTGLLVLEKQNG